VPSRAARPSSPAPPGVPRTPPAGRRRRPAATAAGGAAHAPGSCATTRTAPSAAAQPPRSTTSTAKGPPLRPATTPTTCRRCATRATATSPPPGVSATERPPTHERKVRDGPAANPAHPPGVGGNPQTARNVDRAPSSSRSVRGRSVMGAAGGAAVAPKPPGERRRRNKPARGEWVDLVAPSKPVLPASPPKRAKGTGGWSAESRRLWAAVRSDPASAAYGPAELAALEQLMRTHEEWVRGRWALSAEVRQRMDGLGLTPMGKRALRWRQPLEPHYEGPSAAADELAPRRRRRVAAVES